MTSPGPVLRVQGLAKRYDETPVFEGVDLELPAGRFIALLGESGVGKSTLLNCLAGLDAPTAGRIEVLGQDLAALDEAGRARLRRAHLGFVFQAFHVLPHLSVADNVALPLLLLGRDDPARVQEVLAEVGLQALAQRLPEQLSGGQLQRVAIARALVHRPALLLADEPSGNLDPDTAERVMQALAAQVRQHRAACVLVTHSQAASAHADEVYKLTSDGLHRLG
jgi:putative ABC transport system ATP-binding protein